jgi:CcmD family protein
MDPRNFQFLFYGLAAAWLIVMVYILTLAQRGRKIREEIDRVKQMMREGDQRS